MFDIKKILHFSIAYRAHFLIVGGNRIYDALISEYIRPKAGDNLLDVGCGPGFFAGRTKNIPFTYTGIDISQNYIAAAKAEYGAMGQFVCGDVNSVDIPSAPYDIVIALGLLHHLSDDEASRLAKRIRQLLKPGGRLVTFDGCYADGQSAIARFILDHDRGNHVRRQEGYTALFAPHFASVKTSLRHDLLNFPYTHLIMECRV